MERDEENVAQPNEQAHVVLSSDEGSGETTRIYHDCEGRVEKSVPRIAVWHQEACRVMTNGDPDGRIFLYYPHSNIGYFFLAHHCFFLIIHLF